MGISLVSKKCISGIIILNMVEEEYWFQNKNLEKGEICSLLRPEYLSLGTGMQPESVRGGVIIS